MKEHPILFSGPMVRAILDGRKTKTRRVVRGALGAFWDHPAYTARVVDGAVRWSHDGEDVGAGSPMPRCPYGPPGDRLWVRETFCLRDPEHHPERGYWYAATDDVDNPRWTPSIHMPRRASRLTLEVTAVRVERLQAISEADAQAEGVAYADAAARLVESGMWCEGFAELWDSINGDLASWASNPWVWVVEFKRIGGAS